MKSTITVPEKNAKFLSYSAKRSLKILQNYKKIHNLITTCSQVSPYFCWNCSRENAFRLHRSENKQVENWLQMVMNLSMFCIQYCRCNVAKTRNVFHRLTFKFFLIFCIVFQPLPSGRKKRFVANTMKFYQHLYLDFRANSEKKSPKSPKTPLSSGS